jgi:hypothetical protein
VPGKEILGALIAHYQTVSGLNITPLSVIRGYEPEEVPSQLKGILRDWDNFRRKDVGP